MDYSKLAQELWLTLSDSAPGAAQQDMARSVKGQGFVLAYLAAHSCRAYPKAISEGMMVSSARIAVILRSLEENGLVKRTPDPEDGRQIIVSLTDEGKRMAQKYRDDSLKKLTRMLEYLGPEDALSYVRIRKKLLHMDSGDGGRI